MKKLLLPVVSAAVLFSAASCSKDGESTSTVTTPIMAYNLYTPLAQGGTPSVGVARYSFITKFPDQTIVVTADNMSMPGGANGHFTTKDMPFKVQWASIDEVGYEMLSFSDAAPTSASSAGATVTSLTACVTQAAYQPDPDVKLADYPRYYPGNSMHYVVMQYDINNTWRVRTFWPDVTFKGTTMCSVSGSAPVEDKEMSYRVVMDRSNTAIGDKADIIIYNAAFGTDGPTAEVAVLKGLELKFDNAGYTISGTGVVPLVSDGKNSLAADSSLSFDSFKLVCSGNLTAGTIQFSVGGKYTGFFTGSSILTF